jgi:hypothetical protein
MQPDWISARANEVFDVIPSIRLRRRTLFCFPFTKMISNSALRRAFAAFSARVSFRFCFAIALRVMI